MRMRLFLLDLTLKPCVLELQQHLLSTLGFNSNCPTVHQQHVSLLPLGILRPGCENAPVPFGSNTQTLCSKAATSRTCYFWIQFKLSNSTLIASTPTLFGWNSELDENAPVPSGSNTQTLCIGAAAALT
mmetsp:Transcript_30133/g.47970  ORF Transcript_30133/g.47970 Transcript_30133/m.47970 type:complete len:129 (-) Transcript_30133:115-501(-)